MGMNYYARNKNTGERIHIGKSSYGWDFLFEACPRENLFSFGSWIVFLEEFSKDFEIIDEENRTVSNKDFIHVVSPASRTKKYREYMNDEKAELSNHFYHRQLEEFERTRKTAENNGFPYLGKVKDMQPCNIWRDADGYSVMLGEFS